MVRVGIDIQATYKKSAGLGVYTTHLVQALRNLAQTDYEFCFLNSAVPKDLNTVRRLLWENLELPTQAKNQKIEILHVPAFAPPIAKPWKLVVTVHDLIGTMFPNQKGIPSRFYWGKWLPFAVRRADRIIADSEYTKKDILNVLRIDERKVRVIYPSGHEGFSTRPEKEIAQVREKYRIRGKYFLGVGTLEPRKNSLKLIQAFLQFLDHKRSHSDYQLVLVGSKAFAHGGCFKELLDTVKTKDQILFTDYIEHADLNRLYSGAEAFIFPSFYEGFGIPILEAMASGVPVIASKASSLPEVAGHAAYYIDPNESGDILRGMLTITQDPKARSAMVSKGLERIHNFSWDRTAREVLKVYDSLQE